ncbi:hypothetical protein ACXVUM_05120 [Williamsia sp. SKLECPSW1]
MSTAGVDHPDATLSWDTLEADATLPQLSLAVSELTVILVPVSTWDLFPGHHSVDYARAQGQENIYLNTIALQGLVDRTVTDHLGAQTWIRRRKITMVGSVYPGDEIRAAAEILAVRRPTSGVELDARVELRTARGLVVTAELTAQRYDLHRHTDPARSRQHDAATTVRTS